MGNSLGHMVSPPGGPRAHRTYARWLPLVLAEEGTRAEVVNLSVGASVITDQTRVIEQAVFREAPDVLIINYGICECFSGFFPRWLHRWMHHWRRSRGAVRARFDDRLREPAWHRFSKMMRLVDRGTGERWSWVSPARFQREMTQILRSVALAQSPLVLVLDVPPTHGAIGWLHAGLERRRVLINEAGRAAVSEAAGTNKGSGHGTGGVQARWVQTASLADPDTVLIGDDGIHYTAAGHELVARELARLIRGWMAAPQGGGGD